MKTVLFIFLLTISNFVIGQNLVVTLNNSSTEIFPITDIQSIKFGTGEMILYKLNGTTSIWNIDDIDNYAFDGTSNIDEDIQIIQNELSIYPNPAIDKVTIFFESNLSDKISISIVDINGKEVELLYEGKHNETTKTQWSFNTQGNIHSGTYYCKIKTKNRVITKPIIIQ